MTEQGIEQESTTAGAATTVRTTGEAPSFDLRVGPDQVKVLLDCPDPLADLEKNLDRIMKGFTDLNLPEYPDRDLTREIIEAAASPGEHLVRHVIIMGVAAVPPEPGRIAWSRDFFAAGWRVDQGTGQVDFWEPLGQRSVAAGEEVCRVLPPVPGEPGLDVFGKEISVPTLKPVKLRIGKHLTETVDGDGVRVVTAAGDGRLRYAMDTLTIDEVYVVKGDVSLETGNIRHKGAVMVHGDVRNGATIETNGDVAVRGLVESSTIRCGGDLTVGGGIVGNGEGVVDAGGDVEALYISEAMVKAGGDVTVRNEIAHAVIECRGKVRADRGRIAGGRTTALKGIRVAEAGAGGSTTTLLVAGFDPELEPALEESRVDLERYEDALERLREALDRHLQLPAGQAAAAAATKAELEKKIFLVQEKHDDVTAAMEAMRKASAAEAEEEIVIHEEIWSGTTVQLGNYAMTVRASVHKPRLVRRERSRLKLLPMGEGNMPDD
jgi:uncharacterized protein (DUF342 family)